MTRSTPKGCWRLSVTFAAVIAVQGVMPIVSAEETPWVLFEIGRLIVLEVKIVGPAVLLDGVGAGVGVANGKGRPCKIRPRPALGGVAACTE